MQYQEWSLSVVPVSWFGENKGWSRTISRRKSYPINAILWRTFCCCSCYYLSRISLLDKKENWTPGRNSWHFCSGQQIFHFWIHCNTRSNLMQLNNSWNLWADVTWCMPTFFQRCFYISNPCILGTRPVLPCKNDSCCKLEFVGTKSVFVLWYSCYLFTIGCSQVKLSYQ